MAEEQEDRTEQPSGKRREEARRKGQVARSRELNSALVMTGAAVILLASGSHIAVGMQRIMVSFLSVQRDALLDQTSMLRGVQQALVEALWLLAPFLVLMLVIALLAPLALSGWVFSVEQLKPNFSKLNPIQGMGRIFSTRGLAELVKALIKFVIIGTLASLWIWTQADTIVASSSQNATAAIGDMVTLSGWSFLVFCAAMLLIAAGDVPLQLWEHTKQLRMTRQEVKDEHKQTEGDPHLRGRLRQLQRERASRRMMADVPRADVVVMNPNHYAVALRYQADKHNAPVVVAKGINLIALQIRDVAQAHGVPVVQSPPLARTLYHHAKLGRPIPTGLFLAVAQLLAYVYQLRAATAAGAGFNRQPPEFPIPENMRRDE